MHEFDIIKRFFTSPITHRPDVILTSGDDAAIVALPPGRELAITTDTLVENVHFKKNTDPYSLGFKTLAVNLSDLAAMGADPAWFTLALTLPTRDEEWLENYSRGLFELSKRYNVQLIGGDLTHGPLSMTATAMGFTPPKQALRRDGAKPGDLIFVTHTLGDAALGLLFLNKKIAIAESFQSSTLSKLERPLPRIEIGLSLRGRAHAAIDISDGLASDLKHILEKSHVGAIVYVDKLPLSDAMKTVPPGIQLSLALTGGDDYELCFTAPAELKDSFTFACTCIGEITENPQFDLRFQDGKKYNGETIGYQHF